LIDEGDFYQVIAEVSKDVAADINDGNLILKNERGFNLAIMLPKDVAGFASDSSYRNGILKMRLSKK